jgi:hypothetical protein
MLGIVPRFASLKMLTVDIEKISASWRAVSALLAPAICSARGSSISGPNSVAENREQLRTGAAAEDYRTIV